MHNGGWSDPPHPYPSPGCSRPPLLPADLIPCPPPTPSCSPKLPTDVCPDDRLWTPAQGTPQRQQPRFFATGRGAEESPAAAAGPLAGAAGDPAPARPALPQLRGGGPPRSAVPLPGDVPCLRPHRPQGSAVPLRRPPPTPSRCVLLWSACVYGCINVCSESTCRVHAETVRLCVYVIA